MAISPVSALVNAEASLVSAVAATTAQVQQIATSALPSALAELHDAVEQAKARIQSAAMLYRSTLHNLGFDIASLTAGILEDLESVKPLPTPSAPVVEEATPVSFPLPATDKKGEGEVIVKAITDPDTARKFLSCVVEEEVTTVAANPPSEEPIAAPLVPLQGTQEGETESSPTPTVPKAPGGKGRAAKGKAMGKPK